MLSIREEVKTASARLHHLNLRDLNFLRIIVSANLNLASQPFRNRTLPWTVTAIVALVSLVALFFIMQSSVQTNAQADIVERDVKGLQEQADALKAQAEKVKETLTPEQAQSLEAAHTLADRKHFSWSRLFADLEAELPNSVRVTRIGVRDVAFRGGQTVADLDLSVIGKSPADVTEMISRMDQEGIFHAEPLSQTLQKGKGESGTEWTLYVVYRPRAGAPQRVAEVEKRIATTSTGAEVSKGGLR
jgi:Tfp pilus assembly protein PilN